MMRDISRRRFLSQLGCGALAAAGAASLLERAARAAGAGASKPNIIYILIDDLGWKDMSCYGSKFYETPNINRLASQGMRFTDAYATCTVCSPTRASIVTGKYPARLHLTDWITGHVNRNARLRIPDWRMYLPLEEVTIAEVLKSAGYVTAHMGKWHLGGEPHWPQHQGFDINIGGNQRGQPPSYFAPYKVGAGLDEGAPGEYLTDRLTDEAVKFIRANKDRPFFLNFWHYAVHTPIQAKETITAKYKNKPPDGGQKNAAYAAMIESVDESVGRILKVLDELGIADKTVIFFMSDNGGLLPITSNAPLRAGKGSAYEGGVRDALIVKWPGVVKAGSICSEPVTAVDHYPTILQIAGAPGDSAHNRSVDGVNLVPLLKQAGELGPRAIYWHYPHYHPGGATPYGAVRQGDWKLIEFYEDNHVELYNLREDLSEKRNLAAADPQRAQAMRKRLDDWRKSVDAQMPTPNPNFDPTIRPASRRARAE